MFEVIDKHRPAVRIHDPVFPYARIGVFVKLEKHVLGAGGGRQNLQGQSRCPVKGFGADIVFLAYDQKIRLHHGAVIPIQADVTGGQVYFTFTLVTVHALSEKNVQLTQDFLMNERRRRHVIDYAVDQFDTALVRQGIVVVQCVFALLLSAQNLFFFDMIGTGRLLQSVRISGAQISPVENFIQMRILSASAGTSSVGNSCLSGRGGCEGETVLFCLSLQCGEDGIHSRFPRGSGHPAEDFLYGAEWNPGGGRDLLGSHTQCPFPFFYFFYCHFLTPFGMEFAVIVIVL